MCDNKTTYIYTIYSCLAEFREAAHLPCDVNSVCRKSDWHGRGPPRSASLAGDLSDGDCIWTYLVGLWICTSPSEAVIWTPLRDALTRAAPRAAGR